MLYDRISPRSFRLARPARSSDGQASAAGADVVPLPLGSNFWYHISMKSGRKIVTKKGRGRPATGQGVQIGTRWPEATVASIDTWASSQEDEPSRSEAIRRLVEIGLSKPELSKLPRGLSTAKQSAARAIELAGEVIDYQSDQNVSADERKVRKRKLIQGPSGFRHSRKD